MKKTISLLPLLGIALVVSWYVHDFPMEKDTFYVRESHVKGGNMGATIEVNQPFQITLKKEIVRPRERALNNPEEEQNGNFSIEAHLVEVQDREILRVFSSNFNFLKGNHQMTVKLEKKSEAVLFTVNGDPQLIEFTNQDVKHFPERKTIYGIGYPFMLLDEKNEENKSQRISFNVEEE